MSKRITARNCFLYASFLFTLTLVFSLTSASAQSKVYKVDTLAYLPYYPYVGGIEVNNNLQDDRWFGPFPIGFRFCFMGNVYTECYISTNGIVQFSVPAPNFISGTTFSRFTVDPLLTTTDNNMPRNAILGPWMDWDPGVQGGGGSINYYNIGTSPTRKFVVNYSLQPLFGAQCNNLKGTFQIILWETGVIENIIINKPACSDNAAGGSREGTQAIVDSAGTVAYFGRNYRTNPTVIRDAIAFTDSFSILRYTPDQTMKLVNLQPGAALPEYQINCYDSIFAIKFDAPIIPASLDTMMSEFRFYDGNFQLPIKKVTYTLTSDSLIDSIFIHFAYELFRPGRYKILVTKGGDGDIVYGICGQTVVDSGTVGYLNVINCYTYNIPLVMENVTVENNKHVRISWHKPDTLRSDFFQGYTLYKFSSSKTEFFPFMTFNDINDTSYIDTLIQVYEDSRLYKVAMNVKYNPETPHSDSVSNILLTASNSELNNPEVDSTELRWTKFLKWAPAKYQVEWTPDNATDWRVVGADSTRTLSDTSVMYTKRSPGTYWLRVSTTDSISGLISESNWLKYNVPVPPPLDLEVYNVITPNGDGKNDRFTIKNIDKYPGNKAELFNRWGQKMFSKVDYKNDYSPTDLEPGDYIYKVEVGDGRIFSGIISVLK